MEPTEEHPMMRGQQSRTPRRRRGAARRGAVEKWNWPAGSSQGHIVNTGRGYIDCRQSQTTRTRRTLNLVSEAPITTPTSRPSGAAYIYTWCTIAFEVIVDVTLGDGRGIAGTRFKIPYPVGSA